jgi:hypothetical protein
MNKLTLAWETFDFYLEKVASLEVDHIKNIREMQKMRANNLNNYSAQEIESFRDQFIDCIDRLINLYKKHFDSINDLIKLNNELVDIPPEYEIDDKSLADLKRVTKSLMNELSDYKVSTENFFDDFS